MGKPFPSPGNVPDLRIEPGFPTLQANSLLPEPPGKPMKSLSGLFEFLSVLLQEGKCDSQGLPLRVSRFGPLVTPHRLDCCLNKILPASSASVPSCAYTMQSSEVPSQPHYIETSGLLGVEPR